jgi:hypothetical protein
MKNFNFEVFTMGFEFAKKEARVEPSVPKNGNRRKLSGFKSRGRIFEQMPKGKPEGGFRRSTAGLFDLRLLRTIEDTNLGRLQISPANVQSNYLLQRKRGDIDNSSIPAIREELRLAMSKKMHMGNNPGLKKKHINRNRCKSMPKTNPLHNRVNQNPLPSLLPPININKPALALPQDEIRFMNVRTIEVLHLPDITAGSFSEINPPKRIKKASRESKIKKIESLLERADHDIILYNQISANSTEYDHQFLLLNNINDYLLTAIELCKKCDISGHNIQIIRDNVLYERAHVAKSIDFGKSPKFKAELANLMKANRERTASIRKDKLKKLIAGPRMNPHPRCIRTPLCRPNTPDPEYKEEPVVEETAAEKKFWDNL